MEFYHSMLVADNEFGAPWNDQFYTVEYIEVDTGEPGTEIMTLSGPKKYDEDELYEAARNMFPNAMILNICDY